MDNVPWLVVGLVVGFFVGLVSELVFRILSTWIGSVSSGAPVPLGYLIGMRLRRTPIQLVTDAHVALNKRGSPTDLAQVEGVYLAYRSDVRTEQDLVRLVQEHGGAASS